MTPSQLTPFRPDSLWGIDMAAVLQAGCPACQRTNRAKALTNEILLNSNFIKL